MACPVPSRDCGGVSPRTKPYTLAHPPAASNGRDEARSLGKLMAHPFGGGFAFDWPAERLLVTLRKLLPLNRRQHSAQAGETGGVAISSLSSMGNLGDTSPASP